MIMQQKSNNIHHARVYKFLRNCLIIFLFCAIIMLNGRKKAYNEVFMQTLLKNTQAYRLLKTESEEGRLGHAYLLLLNDARNLRSALKTFAKLFLQNEFEENSPAFQRVCNLIDTENFSDCLFFPAEGKKLAVEDAEKILEESTLNPIETQKKIFVLGDFAEANTQTQNKLLKLLEEPPAGVIFLLGATTVFPVLPTVLSRTKKLEIQPFNIEEITQCLARIYQDRFDEQTLSLCAAASGGSLGEAQNIAEGGHYQTLVENAFALALSESSRLPALVKQIGDTKQQKELLSLLRLLFRDALLLKTSMKNKPTNHPTTSLKRNILLKNELVRIQKMTELYTLPALIYAQEAISEAEKQVKFNAVFPQCIELCIANIRQKNKKEI